MLQCNSIAVVQYLLRAFAVFSVWHHHSHLAFLMFKLPVPSVCAQRLCCRAYTQPSTLSHRVCALVYFP